MPSEFTIIFVAPFYNRSGYGVGARALVESLRPFGLPIKIVPVDGIESGIDDADIDYLKSLERTTVVGTAVLICYHVPGEWMLNFELPPGSIRIVFTTFDGAMQNGSVPMQWIDVCNQMDLVFVPAPEFEAWRRQGLRSEILRELEMPHPWISLANSVKERGEQRTYRFLSVAMFQPRRRWDILIKAFCEEFRTDQNVELVLKVNYPVWHPNPTKPKEDLNKIIHDCLGETRTDAKVKVDDSAGTRSEILEYIDSTNCYVSLDTAPTAPVGESLLRGKLIVIPEGFRSLYPGVQSITVSEEDSEYLPLTSEMLEYQPHHQGQLLQRLSIASVRRALRLAFENDDAKARRPWRGWAGYIKNLRQSGDRWNNYLLGEIEKNIKARFDDTRVKVAWEGSQFVYHSLAHVNRQLCVRLISDPNINLGVLPYERDQFDPRQDMPSMIPLLQAVKRRFESTDVHVRHQWPPNFKPPLSGAWVMIQPWEFGGVPLEWVKPMRELVDEIWVPTSWVRDCYIKSGIQAEKVQVIPNGVDLDVFRPDGPSFNISSLKSFRFLFVGGTIFRKGIDVVLSAYCKAFRKSDDVVLVIKGQSGATYRGTEITRLLEELSAADPDMPEIEYITEGLSEPEIAALYRSCDALVHPYRGEGFGLPIAEAMASGLPVIVTAGGASADFVKNEFAYIIPSERRTTSVAEFESTAAGFWLEEPDETSVVQALQSLYMNPEDRISKGRIARSYAETHLAWSHAIEKILDRLQALAEHTPCRYTLQGSAIIYRVNWKNNDWIEVLMSYLEEFKHDEPVSLVFTHEGDSGTTDFQAATQAVIDILLTLGQREFPEIQVIGTMSEMLELTKEKTIQFIDDDPQSLEGLIDRFGHRLASARMRRADQKNL